MPPRRKPEPDDPLRSLLGESARPAQPDDPERSLGTARDALPSVALDADPDSDLVVMEPIGIGATGVVQRGTQRGLARDVAVKQAHAATDPLAAAQLLREARIAGRLEHPGIVPVHAAYHDTTRGVVVVMKRVRGQAWSERMADPPSDAFAEHVRIAIEVCHALAFAHAHRVLHLDVKPDNVMLGQFGEVCLIDWGSALDQRADPPRTEPVGTPAYLSPEASDPARAPLTPASDVYLLGGCLYRAMYGAPPHRRDTAMLSILAASDPVPFPVRAALPRALSEIVARALATEPSDRFPSVEALRTALEAYLEHLGAERLVDRAIASLRAVEADPGLPAPDAIAMLERVHVELEASRVLWPDNPRALAHLHHADQVLLSRQIAAFDRQGAERTAARLAGLSAATSIELATLSGRDAATDAFRDTMADAADAQADTTRLFLRISAALTLATTAYAVVVLWRRPSLDLPTPMMMLEHGIGLLVLSTVLALTFHRALRRLAHARRITFAVLFACAVMVIHRAIALPAGIDSLTIARSDLLMIAGMTVGLGAIDRAFTGFAALALAGATLSVAVPDATRLILLVYPPLAWAISWAVWARIARRAGQHTPRIR